MRGNANSTVTKAMKFVTILLVIAVLITAMPVSIFAVENEGLTFYSEIAQQNISDRLYDINIELPEGAYLQDATWADNSPVQVEIPPALTYDNSAVEDFMKTNDYTPRTDQEKIEAYKQRMTDEEKALFEAYIALVNANNYFSGLNAEEKKFICEYAGMKITDLTELELMGLNLQDSLPYAQAAVEIEISAVQLLKDFPIIDDLIFIFTQIKNYLYFVDESVLGSEVDIKLREFILNGHSLNQVVAAYGISRALNVDIADLVPINRHNFDVSLSDIEKRNNELWTNETAFRVEMIKAYAETNNLNSVDIEELTELSQMYIDELFTGNSAPVMPSSSIIYGDPVEKNLGIPYSYDYNENEKVNLNTGSLMYETIDYVLPGINGLDLLIGRRYDSEKANMVHPTTSFLGSLYIWDGYQLLWGTDGVINTHQADTYGLGQGWSFMFSSIESINDKKVLHLADGRSFNIGNNCSLKNYTLNDLTLVNDNGAYNNGVVSSAYTLTYKDGKKEYFSGDGKLIGIKDKYGNTIKFVNDTYLGKPRITITDTLNRITTISCSSVTANGYTMNVSLPSSVSLNYLVRTEEFNFEYMIQFQSFPLYTVYYPVLYGYVDAMNIPIYYTHNENIGFYSSGNYQVFGYERVQYKNSFIGMTHIYHPTGAVSEYSYISGVRRVGYDRGIEYAIKERKDEINNAIYNEKEYQYYCYLPRKKSKKKGKIREINEEAIYSTVFLT